MTCSKNCKPLYKNYFNSVHLLINHLSMLTTIEFNLPDVLLQSPKIWCWLSLRTAVKVESTLKLCGISIASSNSFNGVFGSFSYEYKKAFNNGVEKNDVFGDITFDDIKWQASIST